MKISAAISLLISVAWCEPPAQAPYAPSGWRPNGQAFDLPQRAPQVSRVEDSYLPPQQSQYRPANEYGSPDDEDVSVQGLPAQEQTPQFLVSPISGQQYVGPTFDADVRTLDQNYRQSQFQVQQDKFNELQRQRELQNQNKNLNGFPLTQPRLVPYPNERKAERKVTTPSPNEPTTTGDVDYSDDNENQEESVPSKVTSRDKTTVEVTKQNVQQISPELLLSPLTQLAAEQYAYPLQQLGQLRAPIFYQPNVYSQPLIQPIGQLQNNEYQRSARLGALQSILAQRQIILGQPQSVYQPQQGLVPAQPTIFSRREQPQSDPDAVSIDQFNPQFPNGQLQSKTQQNQPSPQPASDANIQNQTNKKDYNFDETATNQNQPRFLANQPQFYQPQEMEYQYQQPQDQQYIQQQQQLLYNQPQVTYQPTQQDLLRYYQNQLLVQQQYNQPQFAAQNEKQGQDALQSGLDVNQQGNDLGNKPKKQNDDDVEDNDAQENDEEGSTATAVATAFGSRTSPPRTFTRYGAPIPNIRHRVPENSAPTEDVVSNAEQSPAIAKADGTRRSSRLRSRRISPVFTLDKSGHLVLAQNQQGF